MILNISESYYSQLQKIDNPSLASSARLAAGGVSPERFHHHQRHNENTDSKPARRMLKLTCTDGVQQVYAIEYEPLNQLREPFIPGFKVLDGV